MVFKDLFAYVYVFNCKVVKFVIGLTCETLVQNWERAFFLVLEVNNSSSMIEKIQYPKNKPK